MLALGLLLWFAKDVADSNLQKGMGIVLRCGQILMHYARKAFRRLFLQVIIVKPLHGRDEFSNG